MRMARYGDRRFAGPWIDARRCEDIRAPVEIPASVEITASIQRRQVSTLPHDSELSLPPAESWNTKFEVKLQTPPPLIQDVEKLK